MLRLMTLSLLAIAGCKARNNASASSGLDAAPISHSEDEARAQELWNKGVDLYSKSEIKYFVRPTDRENMRIAYSQILVPAEAFTGKTVLIVPGFAENFYKYSELAARFHEKGFDVVTINLRAMGYSDRFKKPKDLKMSDQLYAETVHITNAEDYVEDLHYLISVELKDKIRGKLVIFAHSTGGYAAAAYQAKYPGHVKSMVLNSPLFSINMKSYQSVLTGIVSPLLEQHLPVTGSQTTWEPDSEKFSDQTDTTSEPRWRRYVEFLSKNRRLIQAQASRGWIAAIKKATTNDKLEIIAGGMRVPTLLLSAGHDSYVDVSKHRYVRDYLRKSLPAMKDCFTFSEFPDEMHSIWRGQEHEAVFERVISHYKREGCQR